MNGTAAITGTAVLREVRLYGALGREFGRVFRLAVATPGEAVRALTAVLPGFQRAFLGKDGRQAYFVYVGKGNRRRTLTTDELVEPLGATEPIRLVPAIYGCKRNGAGQFILGLVLEAVGLLLFAYTGFDFGLIHLGASLQLVGIIALLSPQRKGKEVTTNLPSYAFDGPTNNAEQGGPVPVAYGRVVTGSVVVSQGLSTDQLVAVATAPPAPPSRPPYEPSDPYTPEST